MNDVVLTTYPKFITQLQLYCQLKESGCIFLTSDSNHSGRIILRNGEITNLGYANQLGNNAIATMAEINRLKYRLGDQVPDIAPDNSLPSTELILRNLAPIGEIDDSVDSDSSPAQKLTAKMQAAIEECLTEVIGPMAEFLCDDYVYNATDLDSALNGLIAELAPEEAEQFEQLIKQKLD